MRDGRDDSFHVLGMRINRHRFKFLKITMPYTERSDFIFEHSKVDLLKLINADAIDDYNKLK